MSTAKEQLSATTIPTPIAESFYDGVRVTYIWNAGFMVTVGEKRILIDAIYEGNPDGILKPVLKSQEPFKGIDLILVTHEHVDHFSPDLVRQYMLENSNTVFASTKSAARKLLELGDDLQSRIISINIGKNESEYFDWNGISVEAIYLSHGIPGFLNLGFICTIGDITLFHTGDIDVGNLAVSALQAYHLPEKGIDIAFLPSFFLTDEAYHAYLSGDIQARYVIPMHFYGRLSLPEKFETALPGYFIFSDSYESWVMPAEVGK
jgi:L-ascorbate metabolism protein UlaG (beta-lactamase superfamily)